MGRFAILSVMTNPTITLGQIAHARSGDKGNRTNIGVLAYTEAGFEWLRTELTARRVAEYFRDALGRQFDPQPTEAGLGASCAGAVPVVTAWA